MFWYEEVFRDIPERERNHALDVMAHTLDEADSRFSEVALLHDLIEDGHYTPEQLSSFGVTPEVIEAVLLVTNRGIPYEEYVANICNSGNEYALFVKIADILDHLEPSKITTLPYHKFHQYLDALSVLVPNLGRIREERLTHEAEFGVV